MTFLWPTMLFLLVLVPLAILLYFKVQQRRRVMAASFSRLGSVKAGKGARPGLRRHIPPALFLLSLVILLVALARPQAEISLPRVEGTVILVFDVSASMGATDAEPTRLEAAKTVAREFVLSQPETVQIGIVTFSGNGFAVQTPTNDTAFLLAAINRLEPTSGTSLGQGILMALNTIAINAGAKPAATDTAQADPAAEGQAPPADSLLDSLAEGPFPNAKIVILSDGENNQSIDPVEAAQAAADRAVRIDAIGFGTSAGATLEVDGFNVHTALDETTLQQITETANGTYYNAQAEPDPQAVYAKLTPGLVVKAETMEVTSVFAAGSILVLIIGVVFSTLWFGRLP